MDTFCARKVFMYADKNIDSFYHHKTNTVESR